VLHEDTRRHTKNVSEIAPAFSQWLTDFFDEYYRQRPVNATFIGVHEYDDQWPDCSAAGLAAKVTGMQELLARLAALPAEPRTAAQQIDRKLAAGFLRIQLWETDSAHFERGNPCFYTGEAAFGLLGLLLTDFAPLADRVASLRARLHTLSTFLAQGQNNVRFAPIAWTTKAQHECIGIQRFLTEGIGVLCQDEAFTAAGLDPKALQAAATEALAAVDTFNRYLTDELSQHTHDNIACGADVLDLLICEGHCLPQSAEEILRYAEAEREKAENYLVAHAQDFGAATWQAALAPLADLHPSADKYYSRFTELWQASYAFVAEQRLVTWPDFPIQYVPRPRWARAAAPYLYFLFYRAPAAYGRPPVHNYLLLPIEDLSPAVQAQLLRGTNDSVIKLNHVVHHGGVGHHIQNWHAYRAESQIGRMAAVDTASRIALFCGGTMAEGWACYATQLMGEAGFLTPLELYAEQQSRMRMCARAIVDIRLHRGEFTLEAAADYYVDNAGMVPAAAQGEAVKNSMFPGAALMYLMGTDTIVQLRSELQERQGDAFDLRAFHDHFLTYGSIPVALIREAMLKAEAERVEAGAVAASTRSAAVDRCKQEENTNAQ